MLIDSQHEGAPGLDFETRDSNNASVAGDHSPEVALCAQNCPPKSNGSGLSRITNWALHPFAPRP
jgi:hypothetical protein